MYLRCLLVPTAPGIDATHRLDAALRLGRRLHAHIGVAFMAPDPEYVMASMAGMAGVASVNEVDFRGGIGAAIG